jgi:F0F1-type ATP synthase gamma subunit
MNTRGAKIVDNETICYYKINPYDLENWDCSSQEDVDTFLRIYMTRAEIQNNVFDRICVIYNRLVSAHQESWMTKELNEIEKELGELSAIFEDKKNVIALSILSDSNAIENGDVLAILYNIIVSPEGHEKYKSIVSKLEKCGHLESVSQILEA